MSEVLIGFGILVALLIIGVPVVYCFGASLAYYSVTLGYKATSIFPTIYGKLSSVVLLSIPLFILAGKIMEHGKIGDALVNFIEMFIGRIKGSLAIMTAAACAVFGAICGSGAATLSCIGSIMLPKMRDKKYPMELAAAVTCCSAPLGMLIPPSGLMIVAAWAANLSVLACFLATVIPGIILTTLIGFVSWFLLRNNNDITSGSNIADGELTGKVIRERSMHAFPALLMPVLILGGIYGGFMTATEAAAVVAVYAIPVAVLVYKGTTLGGMREVFIESAETTGTVMVMCVMTMAMGQVLTIQNVPTGLLNALTPISDDRNVILLLINIFLVLIGMIMDDTCAMMLCTPLLVPIGIKLGVSPYQMCAILGVNIGMGNVTPPTAPFLYMSSGMAGVSAGHVIKYVLIIILFAYIPTILLTTYVPALSVWLPNLILGSKIG